MAAACALADTDALATHRNAYQLFHGNSSVNSSHCRSQNYRIVLRVYTPPRAGKVIYVIRIDY